MASRRTQHHHLLLLLLPLLLISSLTTTTSATKDQCTTTPTIATDVSIFHIYGKFSPFSPPTPPTTTSWFDTILGMAGRDPARLSSLAGQKITTVPVASGQQITQTANYVLRAKLGTPGQLFFLALDTSSDLAWLPCSGCSSCPQSSTPPFSPSSSSTFSTLPCSSSLCPLVKGFPCPSPVSSSPCFFNESYGADSFSASLSRDSLRLALDVIPNYAFGCVKSVAGGGTMIPKQGLLGLGRGPTSLLSQTGSLYGGVFSYCLPSFKSYYFSGSLRLGPAGQPKLIRTTPLLHNPHRPSLYYVNLTGLSVGRNLVSISLETLKFDAETGAGTIVDSGTVITRFVAPAYAAVRDEFRRQVGAPAYSSLGAFDTCFDTSVVAVGTTPVVTLHFEGMDLVLPSENTLIHSSATPVACLAMAAAPANVDAVVNVIANLQQQNHRVLIDVTNSRVGFARELCN